jgi:DNA polymerase-1
MSNQFNDDEDPVLDGAMLRISTDIERPNFSLIKCGRDYEDLLRSISETKALSFDYETSDEGNDNYRRITDDRKRPIDFYATTITGASFRTSDGKCKYLSVDHIASWNLPPEAVADALLAKPKDAPIMAHNYAFEWAVSKHCLNLDLTELGPFKDTMVAAYVQDTNQPVGLKDLVRRRFKILMQSYKTIVGDLKMREIPAERAWFYGCDDSEYQWSLNELLEKELADVGLMNYYEQIELPIVPIIAEMSLRGVALDHELLVNRRIETLEKMADLEYQIKQMVGIQTLNLASPIQVGRLLYDNLKIVRPPYAESDSATDKESLFWNIDKHSVMPLILQYRTLETRNKLYYKPYPNLTNPATQRIHSQLRQTVTDTSRFSSSGPNLQQLAKRGEGVQVRELIVPFADYGHDAIMSCDMSQVELVLAGHRSQSPVMMQAYGPVRGDLHTATCIAVFNITAEEAKANKIYRSAGKTTNFTLIYGGMAKRVYRQVKLDLAKAGFGCPFSLRDVENMIRAYFILYPEIKTMQKNDAIFAKANGFVKSLYGRRFYLPDIYSHQGYIRSKAERKATNSPIQGTCAELIKLSIIKIHKERIPLEDAVMIASVHDENVFSLNSKAAKDVGYIIHKHMAHTPPGLRTYMESEVTMGENFGKQKLYLDWKESKHAITT